MGPAESELLVRINVGLPTELRERYAELVARRQAETLTPEEQAELLQLGSEVERLEAERLQALSKLAQLRQTSLADLTKQLGLHGSTDG